MSHLVALHLDAGHTPNGNPRRVYAIIEVTPGGANVVDVIDEGHRGHGAISKTIPVIWFYGTDRIETTPKEYRDLLRDAAERNTAKARLRKSGASRRSSRRR
jgi:hypothetical protein